MIEGTYLHGKEVRRLEEAKIIELYFERNEQAISETDAKYGKLMYGVAFHVLNDHEDSEECVNDAHAGIWNAIPPTRPNSLMAFACKITRNLALKRLEYLTRDKRSKDLTTSFEELEELLPDERFRPDISEESVGKLISQFLRTQKADVRYVFIRKYFFFDTVSEIAKQCAFTEGKVKSILFQTRNRLREYLRKEGIEV